MVNGAIRFLSCHSLCYSSSTSLTLQFTVLLTIVLSFLSLKNTLRYNGMVKSMDEPYRGSTRDGPIYVLSLSLSLLPPHHLIFVPEM